MAGWNHRLMRHTHIDKGVSTYWYGIHEVYYDADGNPNGWTENVVAPFGETPEEISKEFELMQKALLLPVIDFD